MCVVGVSVCKVHIVQIIVSKYLVHILFSHQTYNAHAHIKNRKPRPPSTSVGVELAKSCGCVPGDQDVVADL